MKQYYLFRALEEKRFVKYSKYKYILSGIFMQANRYLFDAFDRQVLVDSNTYYEAHSIQITPLFEV